MKYTSTTPMTARWREKHGKKILQGAAIWAWKVRSIHQATPAADWTAPPCSITFKALQPRPSKTKIPKTRKRPSGKLRSKSVIEEAPYPGSAFRGGVPIFKNRWSIEQRIRTFMLAAVVPVVKEKGHRLSHDTKEHPEYPVPDLHVQRKTSRTNGQGERGGGKSHRDIAQSTFNWKNKKKKLNKPPYFLLFRHFGDFVSICV